MPLRALLAVVWISTGILSFYIAGAAVLLLGSAAAWRRCLPDLTHRAFDGGLHL